MPNVLATPKGQLNGEVVTEFTDVTSTTSVTYTYPVQQAGLAIENRGVADIYVTVGNYTNQIIKPNKSWKEDVFFTSFSIRSDANSQEFIATAFQNDAEGSGPGDLIGRAKSQEEFDKRGINVHKYGAKGDGITDDTSAFEQAIAAAGIGGNIFVPRGDYVCNRLWLREGQSIYGVGTASKIKLKGQHISTPAGFGGVINGTGSATGSITNIHVHDLYIDGNRANITTPNAPNDDIDIECVNFKYAENCTVNHITVVNAVDSGVDFDNSANCNVTGIRADNCGGYGVHLSTSSSNITVSDSVAKNCGSTHLRGGFDAYLSVKNCKYINCHAIDCYIGFKISGDQNQLVNCSDIGATQNAMRLEGARNKVANFIAENSANNSISISANYNELLNVLVNVSNAGFYIEGSDNKLTNCTAKSTTDGYKLVGASNTLTSCTSVDVTRYGFEVTGISNSLTSCTCSNASTNALRITAASQRIVNFDASNTVNDTAIYVSSIRNVFIGGSARNNAKSGMWVNGVSDNIVQGMSFSTNGTFGIFLDGTNAKIIGCVFASNTSGAVNNTGGVTNKFSLNLGLADN